MRQRDSFFHQPIDPLLFLQIQHAVSVHIAVAVVCRGGCGRRIKENVLSPSPVVLGFLLEQPEPVFEFGFEVLAPADEGFEKFFELDVPDYVGAGEGVGSGSGTVVGWVIGGD